MDFSVRLASSNHESRARSMWLSKDSLAARRVNRFEVVQAIVDCAEQQVQPAGRGRRLFPFNQLIVHVVAASRPDRARLAAVIEGPPSLQQRLSQRLSAAGCPASQMDVQVVFVSKPKPGWRTLEYHVAFDRVETSAHADETESVSPTVEPTRLDLNVLTGMR